MDWTSRNFTSRRLNRIAALLLAATALGGGERGAFAQTPPPDVAAQNPFALRAARDAAKKSDAATEGVPADSAKDGAALEPVATANRVDVLRLKSGETLSGTVERISGLGGATFKTADGATRIVPLDEIERLEASVGADFAKGVDAFETGRRLGDATEFRRAVALLQAARKTDDRRWAKEWATAKIVDALVALGRDDDAAAQFFLICRLDPYSAFLPSAPLRWTTRAAFGSGESPDARRQAEDEAARWLPAAKNPSGVANPLGRLLAASILLDSARYKKDAVEALRDLAVCEPPEDARDDADAVRTCRTVALLAAAQRWRLETLTNPTAETVDRWAETAALLPVELRSGPAFLVATGNESLGRDDAAADGFLRVALLAATNRNLAERATGRAAAALERLGRKAEAEALRRDAERRFAETR